MSGTSAVDRGVIAALRELEDDQQPELVAELIDLFVADAPDRLRAIEEGLREGDPARVERGAHSLKGASANLGAWTLSRLAARLTEAARAGSLDGGAEQLAALRAEWERVRAELLEIRGPRRGGGG